jgi:small subunit ribosomal protein S17
MHKRKSLVGEVISNKMEKTVVVEIGRTVQHPRYGKVMRRRTTLKAHDERKECRVGDKVRVVECRPLSKETYWRVTQVLAHAERVEPVPVEGVS